MDSAETDDAIRRGIEDLRWILSGDLTFTALAEEWLAHRSEDVVAVYLRGPDAVCHKFWGERERRASGVKQDRRAALFAETVDRYYEETDRLIARILARVDLSRTTVLLVSDHGFQGGRRALDGSVRVGIYMHRELGTILVAGPGAKGRGVRADGARVVDVFPTLLHLLDLPVGEDMDGEPARWLLSRTGGAERPVRRIATYETGQKPDVPGGIESPVDEQIRERVEALGYVE
jgi:predicted AlkP superfamily phosphohydrolase/phosphomutase